MNLPSQAFAVGAGTLTIHDGGDGFMNAAETASGIPASWENLDPAATSADVWFEDASGGIPAGCGPWTVGPTGSGAVNPTCAASLPEGEFTFKAEWTDGTTPSGVVTSAATTKDNVSPAPPSVQLATANIANVASVPTTGDADAGTINLSIDDADGTTAAVTASAPVSGAFSISSDLSGLADGTLDATASVTDAAGNTGSTSATSALKDTVAPAAPVISAPVEGVTVGGSPISVAGTAAAGDKVKVLEGATQLHEATADGAGDWTASIPFSDGAHSISVVSVDAAGNEGPSSTRSFTVDLAPPLAGTAMLLDGDGYVNAADAAAGLPVNWTRARGSDAVGAEISFVDSSNAVPAACGPFAVEVTGESTLSPACAAALPQGDFALRAVWIDEFGNRSDPFDDGSVKDTVAPAAIDLDHPDTILRTEAAAGIPLNWTADTALAQVTLANEASTAPAACTMADQAATGSATIGLACFGALQDGNIVASVTGTDIAGNASSATDTAILQITAGKLGLEILDGADNADGTKPFPAKGHVDNRANAQDTLNGTALKVRLDPDPATATGILLAQVTLSDGTNSIVSEVREIEAISSVELRTFTFNATTLRQGLLTATGTITNEIQNVTTKVDSTTLDLVAPQTSFDQADGTMFVSVNALLFTLSDVVFTGATTDPSGTSGVQFVYIMGKNVDTGATFGRTAVMESPEAGSTGWSLELVLPAGEWEITSRTQDTSGNLAPDTAPFTVQVLGF
ncbi:MAG TPA: Ig-like domain-containing protein [Actinomycetota bacterium]|nr:Ig-like domain-containing protein [Actinomycetota bacterium]